MTPNYQVFQHFSLSIIPDNRFLKTFVTTYQSFTTPAKLFEKLLQRYNVRRDRVDAGRVKAIQLRVCVVLKYWVENQVSQPIPHPFLRRRN